jgi:hypothetical protein
VDVADGVDVEVINQVLLKNVWLVGTSFHTVSLCETFVPLFERVHVQVTNSGKSADFRLKSGVGNDVVELPASHLGDIADRFL